jgi:hypothetical protein
MRDAAVAARKDERRNVPLVVGIPRPARPPIALGVITAATPSAAKNFSTSIILSSWVLKSSSSRDSDAGRPG